MRILFLVFLVFFNGLNNIVSSQELTEYLSKAGINVTERYSVYWKLLDKVLVESNNGLDELYENPHPIIENDLAEHILELKVIQSNDSLCESIDYAVVDEDVHETQLKKEKIIKNISEKYEKAVKFALEDNNCKAAGQIRTQHATHITKVFNSTIRALCRASTRSYCYVELWAKVVKLSLN